MKRRSFQLVLGCLALTNIIPLGCASTAPPTATTETEQSPQATVELTVSAAASTQDALQEIEMAYEQENPAVDIVYNFGSSGSLAQQIAQGAPSDVFLSASKKWMDDLETKGQILDGSRQDLLANTLVLIAPKDKTEIKTFEDLATDQVQKVAIGEPASVPAGQYAKESLTAMNLFDPLQAKLVFAKDVRQVVSYVETGNVDAGLVYNSDAKASAPVQVVAIAPSDSHKPITYPVGVVAETANPEAAQAFVDFLAGETASAIFADYGFQMAE